MQKRELWRRERWLLVWQRDWFVAPNVAGRGGTDEFCSGGAERGGGTVNGRRQSYDSGGGGDVSEPAT